MNPGAELQELLGYLAEVRGLDLRGYKLPSLQRRLRKRMQELQLETYDGYLRHLRGNHGELNELLNTVLVNYTEFFRDPQAWRALRREAFPLLFSNFPPGSSFRAWCAGCATGEEVYTLAILLAEWFGPAIREYEIKIYANDSDEQALAIARRGQYSAERLARVPAELREKYFSGKEAPRVRHELRRLAIFGRSDLVSNAPISHVQLVVCRNVLIYFDAPLQHAVLERFRFALDEGGILFLGRSESQLQGWSVWRPVSSKWRIFQRAETEEFRRRRWPEDLDVDRLKKDHQLLQMWQRNLLETVGQGVIMLDADETVTLCNDSARAVWGVGSARLQGQRIEETPVFDKCPELGDALARSRTQTGTIRFECSVKDSGGDARMLSVAVRAVTDENGVRSGTVIYVEDVTAQDKLRGAMHELEITAEELQSSNEELETTNEELQSANEELETANEELQSLNEELEAANNELETRTRDLDILNEHFIATLSALPLPVLVVSKEMTIEFWNRQAERLFGLPVRSVAGLRLDQLPIEERTRREMMRNARSAMAAASSRISRRQEIRMDGFEEIAEIHYTPFHGGLLLMLQRQAGGSDWQRGSRSSAGRGPSAKRARTSDGAGNKAKAKSAARRSQPAAKPAKKPASARKAASGRASSKKRGTRKFGKS